MKEYAFAFIALLNEMSPYLLLGFFVAGILHVYVPQSIYQKHLSKPGFASVFKAAIFGIPLPLCSCGVIPTATSLKKEGASDGATTSFLIATPQTGVDSIFATYALCGLPFAIIRPFVALFTAMFGGLIVDKSGKKRGDKNSEHNVATQKMETTQKSFKNVMEYGFVTMLQDIGSWLVVGLLVAGAITVLIPNDFFSAYADMPIVNMLVILLLSVPMYICATGSIPIAVSLMLKGISPGAALVLLMAGPATNIASLVVLRKVLGLKNTILYLLSIVIGAIGFGLLIDYFLPVEWFTSALIDSGAHAHHHGVEWWKAASSVIFCALLINAYIRKYRRPKKCCCTEECGGESSQNTAATYRVEGMRCNQCKAAVERALREDDLVESVVVDLNSSTVTIVGQIGKDRVKEMVEKLGYKFID